MNRKVLTALIGVAVLSAATLAVYAANERDERTAHGSPMPRGPDMDFMHPGMIAPMMLRRLADQLDLTAQQRQTIKGLLESVQPNMRSMRQEMQASADLLRTTDPDSVNYANVVAQASQKAGELASRMVTDGSQLRAQVWQILTPEQRAEFQTIQTKFRGRLHERRLERQVEEESATAEVQTMVVSATRIRA